MPLDLTDLTTDAINQRATLAGMVYVLHNPKMTHLRFEWHPAKEVVYMIRLDVPNGERLVGEPIAYHIQDHGAAHNAMLVFFRGYRERDREIDRGRVLDNAIKWS